jgi:hypothetical protein
MGAAKVTGLEKVPKRLLRLPAGRILSQVHFLLLHRHSEPLDGDVVQRPAATVHRDL